MSQNSARQSARKQKEESKRLAQGNFKSYEDETGSEDESEPELESSFPFMTIWNELILKAIGPNEFNPVVKGCQDPHQQQLHGSGILVLVEI